ncbi:MAG TPA: hypothetical protein VG204_11665 [Terriglobia bacterium]|nr:hypothetical protein [Terriglobia bacterium]
MYDQDSSTLRTAFESIGCHAQNRHVRDKIRQQLQVLRDLGFVVFLGRGQYRLPQLLKLL